jgi:hypothetical protein
VFAKYSPYLIAEPIEVSKSQPPISTGTSKNLCSKRRSVISVSFLQRLVRSMQTAVEKITIQLSTLRTEP